MKKNSYCFIDFDNTLYRGKNRYLILDFPVFLAAKGHFNNQSLKELGSLQSGYSRGKIERDEFAIRVVESYYQGLAGEHVKNISSPKIQLSIFDAHSQTFEEIREMLSTIDINRLTPVEALLKLSEIKNLLK